MVVVADSGALVAAAEASGALVETSGALVDGLGVDVTGTADTTVVNTPSTVAVVVVNVTCWSVV